MEFEALQEHSLLRIADLGERVIKTFDLAAAWRLTLLLNGIIISLTALRKIVLLPCRRLKAHGSLLFILIL